MMKTAPVLLPCAAQRTGDAAPIPTIIINRLRVTLLIPYSLGSTELRDEIYRMLQVKIWFSSLHALVGELIGAKVTRMRCQIIVALFHHLHAFHSLLPQSNRIPNTRQWSPRIQHHSMIRPRTHT